MPARDFLYRIDNLLLAKRLRRPWLAEKTGVSLSTINTWFKRGAYPTADDAFLIAQALNTSVEFLMSGKDPHAFLQMDPIKSEICGYVMKLEKDKTLELRGILKLFNYMSLQQDMGGDLAGDKEAESGSSPKGESSISRRRKDA